MIIMDNSFLEPYNLVEPPAYLQNNTQDDVKTFDDYIKFQNLISKVKDFSLDLPTLDFPDSSEKEIKENNKEYVFNNKKEFINTLKPLIYQELLNQNIDTNYTDTLLAQLALESAWGKKPSGKNNFAGLKGSGSTKSTKEYINGRYINTKSSFKDFDSLQDFVKYYIKRLDQKFNAFSEGDFVTNIKSKGYFTDSLNKYKRTINLLVHNIKRLS